MTERDMNYGRVLFELGVSKESIDRTKALVSESKELVDALSNPVVKKSEKEAVIDRLFDKEMGGFLKVLCENAYIDHLEEIFEAYEEIVLESKNMIRATLRYVTKPSDAQIEGFKQMICKKYNKVDVLLQLKEDQSLIGGFVLKVEDTEYDKSIKGRIFDLQKTLLWR